MYCAKMDDYILYQQKIIWTREKEREGEGEVERERKSKEIRKIKVDLVALVIDVLFVLHVEM